MTASTRSSTKPAVILLGRGGYSDAPAEQLSRLRQRVTETGRYLMVKSAMVDQGSPSLTEALDACANAGAGRILVIPVFMPDDRNLSRWLAKIVRRWLKFTDATHIEIVMADSLGDQKVLGDAVVKAVLNVEDNEALNAEDIKGERFGDPEWSLIPPHNYHVFTCRGPRCTALGSGDVWHHLAKRLEDESLIDKSVLVAQMVPYTTLIWHLHTVIEYT